MSMRCVVVVNFRRDADVEIETILRAHGAEVPLPPQGADAAGISIMPNTALLYGKSNKQRSNRATSLEIAHKLHWIICL